MSVVRNCHQLPMLCIKGQSHYVSFEGPSKDMHVCSLQGAGKRTNTGKTVQLSTVSWETKETLTHRMVVRLKYWDDLTAPADTVVMAIDKTSNPNQVETLETPH